MVKQKQLYSLNFKNMRNIKIAIIGYGELGKAIHRLLKNNVDLSIEIWDKKDKNGGLKDAVSLAEIVFVCVPSWCAREALEGIKIHLNKKSLVICLSKGIEDKTSKTIDLILDEVLGSKINFAILSGPMIAEELLSNKKGFAILASKNKRNFTLASAIFNHTNLIIKYSKDLRGVALCGVLKNIYALGIGICDGLNLGGNSKGALFIEAIKEMTEIVGFLGGKKESVYSYSGVGDLTTTAFSNFSRNREVGETLAKTGICCLESEGYKSMNSLIKIIGKGYIKFPFLKAIKSIILDNKKSLDAFSDLLK